MEEFAGDKDSDAFKTLPKQKKGYKKPKKFIEDE